MATQLRPTCKNSSKLLENENVTPAPPATNVFKVTVPFGDRAVDL